MEKERKKAAQEVPVQEQHKVEISFDKKLIKAKQDRINYLVHELKKEINSIPEALKVELLK